MVERQSARPQIASARVCRQRQRFALSEIERRAVARSRANGCERDAKNASADEVFERAARQLRPKNVGLLNFLEQRRPSICRNSSSYSSHLKTSSTRSQSKL